MLTFMGLAVGIDYCLFIVSRFREERARGPDVEAHRTSAGMTAGRAVMFSGLTVVLALVGMLIVPTQIFISLAVGAIVVVLVTMVAALTLLPACFACSATGSTVAASRSSAAGHSERHRHGGSGRAPWRRRCAARRSARCVASPCC